MSTSRVEVLAEHGHRQGRSRPRAVESVRGAVEQLVAAVELLDGDRDVTLLQRRGGPPQRSLAVAQVAVRLGDGDDRAEDGDAGDDRRATTAIRRTVRRASRPRRDRPVTTMTAAISAGHERRQAEAPRRLPPQAGR